MHFVTMETTPFALDFPMFPRVSDIPLFYNYGFWRLNLSTCQLVYQVSYLFLCLELKWTVFELRNTVTCSISLKTWHKNCLCLEEKITVCVKAWMQCLGVATEVGGRTWNVDTNIYRLSFFLSFCLSFRKCNLSRLLYWPARTIKWMKGLRMKKKQSVGSQGQIQFVTKYRYFYWLCLPTAETAWLD